MTDTGSPVPPCRDPCRRVLIVEDDRVSATLLRRVLESRGYVVDHAANGASALNLQEEGRHRIVITDWMMPEMDGMELCRRIRAQEGPYVYVIALTAKSQREDRIEAFEAGIDDFITKPFERDELFTRLQVATRIIRSEDTLEHQKRELQRSSERLAWSNINMEIASRRFEGLFSGLPVACFTFDVDGTVFEWNVSAEHLFGIPAYRAFQQPLSALFPEEIHPVWNPEVLAKVLDGEPMVGLEWHYVGEDGVHLDINTNLLPLRAADGANSGGIAVCIDLTEHYRAQRVIEQQLQTINEFATQLQSERSQLEVANDRLGRLAVTDGLTDLWNHRHFQEQLRSACEAARRNRQPLSLVMLDVDHFKRYNDTYGHPAGDAVLKTVASLVRSGTREGTEAARYGGEEFTLILENTNCEKALIVAERIREQVARHPWPQGPVTVSIGVSTSRAGAAAPVDLIRQADEAMYCSKHAGRDQVTHYKHAGRRAAAHGEAA